MDYRSQVEQILRSANCHPVLHIGDGVFRWYSPKTKEVFSVPPVIRSSFVANEIMKAAGEAEIF